MSWPRPSLTLVLVGIFVAWIGNSLWTIYSIYHPKSCSGQSGECLNPAWSTDTTFLLFLCTSTSRQPFSSQMNLIYQNDHFQLHHPAQVSVTVPPDGTRGTGALFLHVIVTSVRSARTVSDQLLNSRKTVHSVVPLIKMTTLRPESYSLLQKGNRTEARRGNGKRPVSHWKPRVVIDMAQPLALDRRAVPGEIADMLYVNEKGEYMPILFHSELRTRVKDLVPIAAGRSDPLPLTIAFEPAAIGKIRFMKIAELSMKTLHELGFSEYDTDDVKGIFFDTNFYLLLLTIVVTSFHLLFDFLAFKSDIQFWKNCNSMAGLSYRSLIWRSVSQSIITVYLYDQGTSLLVLGPAVIATVIEFWKLNKVSTIDIRSLSFKPKSTARQSDEEKITNEHDAIFMKYLSLYILYPLVSAGSIYSLVYSEHKSWHSWAIESAANGVYAFGFLFMLPQLFINFKMKSVAHLPWKPFMYKAFNTFIDDLFAFLITSTPTSHRVAAFRDDIVFLIYLYQRW